ncbi:carbamoyltransferase N-terminal domain-containing protein [Streptomyces sp. ISL-11]|uniref:carbamoyltransferase family protein n=1 Tax=Streptomyces sp. ISL-11 TaxID=2819174 RepID=UPI001BE77C50|nr:carbamoyltransferase N-terminal domain-containing protein [Streptomyces sp. ISL-11]MBT2384944.1 hypothetical protein [Streptomyces sp. ISL-11]
MTQLVLGLSAFSPDSAAALVADGVPVAAAQEERFSRRRHDPSFPRQAVDFCLRSAGADLADLTAVAYFEDPELKFRRVRATWAGSAPYGFTSFREDLPAWLDRKRTATRTVRDHLAGPAAGPVPEVVARRHHESHAASAFFAGPYESAAVLCVDGVGEWATTTVWHGSGTRLRLLAELRYPHSLGLLYSAFTHFCGFTAGSGEHRLMGLAPHGTPRFARLIRERLIDIKDDGSFRLDLRWFAYARGRELIGPDFEQLLGGPRRQSRAPLTAREADLAASVQKVTEEVVVRLARTARRLTGEPRLCLAGDVALNCAANARILEEAGVDALWVQPAAGDAGAALGAALAVAHERGAPRSHVAAGRDAMTGALLGPEYTDEEIGAYLDGEGLPYERLGPEALARRVAEALDDRKLVGWFQGRMEFGPRALGSRSILADARDPGIRSVLSLRTRLGASLRPFAPAVLAEEAKDWFDLRQDSPYMLITGQVAAAQRLPVYVPKETAGLELLRVQRSTVPAVTHVDGSARVQTVDARHPALRRLLLAFKELTGCPVLVNTSFAVRGEPVVNTPREAYACFRRTGIDLLALGGFLLRKEEQPPWRGRRDARGGVPVD